MEELQGELSSRIDLVLTDAAAPAQSAEVGDEPFQDEPPLWPSDHTGVVSVVRIH